MCLDIKKIRIFCSLKFKSINFGIMKYFNNWGVWKKVLSGFGVILRKIVFL